MHYRLLLFFLFATLLKVHAHGDKNRGYPFIENKGQWIERVQFKAELEGATIFFESNSFHYQFIQRPDFHRGNQPEDTLVRGHVFNANFIGSKESVAIEKEGPSTHYYNYYLDNDPTKWASSVKLYHEIEYQQLYDGIDLKVYQHEGLIKYDYHVAPGYSPNVIEVEYEGVDQLFIQDGSLKIKHSLGELIEEKPYAYQVVNGEQIEVPCQYRLLENGHVGFVFPKGYDTQKKLIIDPTLVFSTYSGSTADNFGQTATYDDAGNGYMGGIVGRVGYVITPGAYQQTYRGGQWDIAISKLNSIGDTMLYSTFLGGAGSEAVHSLVVDASENLYLLGTSSSPNYPTTTNAFKTTKNTSTNSVTTDIGVGFVGGVDIVVTKFNRAGTNLLGSTYFGGNESDGINQNPASNNTYDGLNFNYGDYHRGEIIIDSLGACYIGTTTYSDNITTITNGRGGGQDGLIVKFNNDLSAVNWSRYLGGSGRDAINSLKVIDNNRVLVGGGTTDASSFPTTINAYTPSNTGGEADGFISIISANGTTVERSAIVGTSNYDQVYFIEFDRFNQVYAYGQSEGGNFPTKNSPNSNAGAGQFLLKMDENLDSLVFSKTFGDGQGNGTVNISPTAFLVDRCQNLYAAGWGGDLRPSEGTKILGNLPIRRDTSYGPLNSFNPSGFYLYVTYLDPNINLDTVYYANLIGGSSSDDHVDGGTSRFDKNGVIYHSVCASCGGNRSDFPTTANAHSTTNNSTNCNNLLFKLDLDIAIQAKFLLSENEICLEPGKIDSVTIFNTSVGSDLTTWDFYGDTVITSFNDTTIYFSQPGIYQIQQVVFDSICVLEDKLNLIVNIRPDDINLTMSAVDSVLCLTDSTEVSAFTNGFATEFVWSRDRNFTSLLSVPLSDSTPTFTLQPGVNTFYVEASDPSRNACEKIDSVSILYIPVNVGAVVSADSVCIGTPVQFGATLQNVDNFLWKFGDGTTDPLDINPEVTYTTPGRKVTTFIYENNRCLAKDSVSLEVFIQPNDLIITAPQDSLYCGVGVFDISLNSSGTITQYQYSSDRNFSDTLNVNLQTNSIRIPKNDSSLYYLKISNQYCERSDSILIEYIEYDIQLAPIIDTVCTPFSVQVNTSVLGVDSFRITASNGFSTTNDPNPVILFEEKGVFDITIVGSNSRCKFNNSESESIHVFQSVPIVPALDTLICLGEPVQIAGNTQGVANEFLWSSTSQFTDTLPILADSILAITPEQTSLYYFKATNVVCESFDTVQVNVEELTVEVNDFRSICIFDTIQMNALVAVASSPLSFTWAPDDSILNGQNTGAALVAPLNNSFFFLETLSETGCKDLDTIEVEVNLPNFNDALIFGVDSLYKGQETQLSTNRNGSELVYQWDPPNGIDNVNSPNPNVTLDSSKEYIVTITDLETNCVVVARRRLIVFEVNCAEPDIFIPTAFTPNRDSNNDILLVRGANLREIEFQVFNRWGELIFETRELNKGWDGTYQGKVVDPGVFVYQLKAICFDGQEYIGKGNITLIR